LGDELVLEHGCCYLGRLLLSFFFFFSFISSSMEFPAAAQSVRGGKKKLFSSQHIGK